jgi:DNA-binding transcriptional ArsR family regulator
MSRSVVLESKAPAVGVPPGFPDGLPVFLRLLAEPNRLRILALLAQREHCVCEIEATLDLAQNLTSHHLSALRKAGLVQDRRDGKWVYYSLNGEVINPHLHTLIGLLDTTHAHTPAPRC